MNMQVAGKDKNLQGHYRYPKLSRAYMVAAPSSKFYY